MTRGWSLKRVQLLKLSRGARLRARVSMQYILAIDQGTQSTRVFLYDKDARPVVSHQETFKQIYPKQGCVLSVLLLIHLHAPDSMHQ